MKDYIIDREKVEASFDVKCRECGSVISSFLITAGSSAQELELYMQSKFEPCKSMICVNCQRELGIEADRDDALSLNKEPQYCQCVECQKLIKEKYSKECAE